jgi:oligopeptide/dipeptide ABC transporter ATP-binding protein
MNRATVLEVIDLVVEFPRPDGVVRAADKVSFSVGKGEVLGLVGESGCGKSATALALLRLLPPPGRLVSGAVVLDGVDLTQLSEKDLRPHRGAGLAYVPQEPGLALNPVLTVGSQIVDVIRAHRPLTRRDAWTEAVAALARVGIADPERRAKEYAHQFSGGMKQRALIAMALSARPKVLLADEPTTAIDPTLQAGILDLLHSLAERDELSVVLITHDLGVVAAVCDRVVVMYAGRVVEESDVDSLFRDPRHPYSQALLRSLPRQGIERGALPAIPGAVPDLAHLPPGCAFHPRCALAVAACRDASPPLVVRPDGRKTACLLDGAAPGDPLVAAGARRAL